MMYALLLYLNAQNTIWSREGGPCGRTSLFYSILQELPQAEVQSRIVRVLEFMEQLHLDVATFLYYFSWHLSDVPTHGKLKYARTALMHSDLLTPILQNWMQPPRMHQTGIRTEAAKKTLSTWAVAHVKTCIDAEMQALAPVFTTSPDKFDEARMLSIKLPSLIATTKALAPVMWDLAHAASTTPRQLQRNTYKNSEPVIFSFCASRSE